MPVVIKIIGSVLVLLAVLYLIKPDVTKGLIGFFKEGKRLYLAGLLRLVLAVIFLLAASQCYVPAVIIVLGILFLLGGLLIFVLGPGKLRPMLEWWQRQSPLLLRIIGLITLAIGALIIYAA